MSEIHLSGKEWRNPDNFWDDFLSAVGAPKWHGRNLDALSESISSHSFSRAGTPYRIVVSGVRDLPKSIVFLLFRINQLLNELAAAMTPQGEIVFPEGNPPGWDYVSRADVFRHMRVLDVLREWDPIGVYGPGSSCPDDEYDSYAAGIMTSLERGASTQEIARHLSAIVKSSMGLTGPDSAGEQSAAEHLKHVWDASKVDASEGHGGKVTVCPKARS